MLIITAAKMLVIASVMITLAGAALGTGILFAGYITGSAKTLKNQKIYLIQLLMAFALIETFVFLSFLVAGLVYTLL